MDDIMEKNSSVIDASLLSDIELLNELQRSLGNPDERDKRGRMPLHLVAIRGRVDLMEKLLLHGADVNAMDVFGNQPLHLAGHVGSVECLVRHGASILVRNVRDETPCILARRRGVAEEVIKYMEKLEQIELQIIKSYGQMKTGQGQYKDGRLSDNLLSNFLSAWYDFCLHMGAERLVIFFLVVIVVSLYVAYLATGLVRQIDTRIPIDAPFSRDEL